ncbi:uncharacterized protein SPPG_03836 [Spizellomyces punctatus DAOM BR117]|uniref:GDP-Man:Man(1)GlcNAc(2)-PP-Dol alpha-1,3-mannosyltransferase n=1 Tax=Spizellomyces punctatus (strain DAOM BR117) TaxID=645134 RepID=A0A0L0HIM2_SPIPD|nr:uncharacterized protein SPPG_03836 [Spizellomyces punctatus DAOM BR117]KND00720.1 hypothetical protein SPPG_03836 [Spizellomyces punctatus DAOM BR117]|eukprot:XP_016608759.1 hypothetical protein SPPG_03836 [Spizellomyces punctatus DAOM BR117]
MTPLRIAFVHPDLGIGGAERLVVDAAVGLQSRGHSVVLYTSHHDPTHCFQETRDGTLKVSVAGDWLPRHLFGKGYILFAILRSVVLSFSLCLGHSGQYDLLVVDQLSASIPVLRFANAKILFYCHFPDKLLTKRQSLLKKIYRLPVDFLEEQTTRMADKIVVNSRFTAGVFMRAFPSIKQAPDVLYPGVPLKSYCKEVNTADPTVIPLMSEQQLLLSINRFERKKNIELAIYTFERLREQIPGKFPTLRLIVAGGYDTRVRENVEYLEELELLAIQMGFLTHVYNHGSKPPPKDAQVVFIPSFNDEQRTFLLARSLCLLYTPSEEHFGIVPVEAMYAGLPVIAVNNGGPTETVVDSVTGFLRNPDPTEFADAIAKLATGVVRKEDLGSKGKTLVEEKFSSEALIDELERIISTMRGKEDGKGTSALYSFLTGFCILLALLSRHGGQRHRALCTWSNDFARARTLEQSKKWMGSSIGKIQSPSFRSSSPVRIVPRSSSLTSNSVSPPDVVFHEAQSPSPLGETVVTDGSWVDTDRHQNRTGEFLSVPGPSVTEEGSPSKRSLASRRSSSASAESVKLRENTPSLQPPKLDTTGFSIPVFIPASPMSAGTQFSDNIVSVGNMLEPQNVPPWLQRLLDSGPAIPSILREEYQEIDSHEVTRIREGGRISDHPYSLVVAQQRQHMRRNRYYDIIPYDRTRVVLGEASAPELSDYINASHVQGLPGTRSYIVSQGPMSNTFGDFWQMVWEQRSGLIIMLTKEEERGRIKCHRYWPSQEGEELEFENISGISVKLVQEQNLSGGDVMLRQMEIATGNDREKRRRVWQLHFVAWPDHKASSPQSVLAILDLARELQTRVEAESEAGPMVVHCSAGCGRTGTFCAIDGVITLLENGDDARGELDVVHATVEKFREHRVSMVQTLEQYAFCYEAVLYRLLEWQHGVGKPPSWITQFQTAAALQTVAEKDPISGPP